MGPLFDLCDLRAFLAVAEAENLGRAAEHLHVSASPLSRHMIQLEARLGLALFERSRKRLRLTSAGHQFRMRASALLSHAAEIERAVSSAIAGETGQIEIGYVPGVMWSGFLPNLIRQARTKLPGVEFRLHSMRSGEGREAVGRGALDVAFVHTIAAPDNNSALARTLVHQDAFCLAVNDGHDLAKAKSDISPAALGKERWITLACSRSPDFRTKFVVACGAYGFVPDIRYDAPDIPSVLGLVEADVGIALLQSAVKRMAPPGISFVTLPNFPLDVRVYVQWRREDRSEIVRRFLELIEAI